MIKRPVNLDSLPRISCFTSLLLHLFNCFLIISSPTHRSHRLSHHLSLSLSHHPITHRLLIVHAISHVYHQLHHHDLSQHHYNQNIASPSTLHFIACNDLNSYPTTTTHSNLSCSIPLRVRFSSFTSPHRPLSISAPNQKCNDPVPYMQGCVPSRARFHSLTYDHRFQHARFCSLACKVLFLTMHGPVSTCHHPFLSMSSSVPTCNFQNLSTTSAILSRILPFTIPSRPHRSLHEISCNRRSVGCISSNRIHWEPTPDHHHMIRWSSLDYSNCFLLPSQHRDMSNLMSDFIIPLGS